MQNANLSADNKFSLAPVSLQYLAIPVVLATWSASAITSGVHSGWTTTLASGCAAFSLIICSDRILMMGRTISFPKYHGSVQFGRYITLPDFLSGTKSISCSLGIEETIFIALEEVQHTSLSAFIAAVLFT